MTFVEEVGAYRFRLLGPGFRAGNDGRYRLPHAERGPEVTPETLPYAEQLRLLAEAKAKVVVGAHGLGLASLSRRNTARSRPRRRV